MTAINLWSEGDTVLLRGIYEGQLCYCQSARVIHDTPKETALLVWPGAECVVPNGYLKHAHNPQWDRWQETFDHALDLKKFIWHTNRFLILLEPEKFHSSICIWEAASGEFTGYYINFQLPFRRTHLGFDTLDLDLDMVIEPSLQWRWKDVGEYEHGIQMGGIKKEWVQAIELAQPEIIACLQDQRYPFDGAWLGWQPDPSWPVPRLPEDWHQP